MGKRKQAQVLCDCHYGGYQGCHQAWCVSVKMPDLSSNSTSERSEVRDALRDDPPLKEPPLCESFCQPEETSTHSKYSTPAGYVSDLVDGARFTIEDPDDVAIAVFTRPQIEGAMFERFARHVGIARQELQKLAEDFHEVIADHNRLVRELDVLLNGEAGAARQASLCDIVGQVQREGIRSPMCKRRATGKGK